MENVKKMSLFRILAVVLALLCIVLLFFPPYVGFGGEARTAMKEAQSYMGYLTAFKDLAITQITSQYGIDRSEAEAMFRLIEHIIKPDLSLNDLRVSFNAINLLKDSKAIKETSSITGGFVNTDSIAKFTAHVVILNVLFFAVIAAAVLAAVLYLLSNSKIGGIILIVITCLCTAEAVFFVIKSEGVFFPHAAAFLLPIFAIASLIFFVKKPAAAPRPAFEGAPVVPETLVPDAAPIPEEKLLFCPNCGAKLEEGASFCANCGEKIN